eukprot:m.1248162 g.1248162  ORF g.1248162 m.1248162 type:complete len:558 (-) comp24697_c0_seq11:2335-4008(-)
MNCTIPGPNIKVFGKAIHTLSKIGEDLYFEGQSDVLSLRTVNSSRSAYACFEFSRAFFQSYKISTLQQSKTQSSSSQENAVGIHCKALSKSCLSVFRSLSQIDKTVTKCKVSLSLDESRLEIQFHCKHGVVKTYKLHIEDADSIKALYDTDTMSSAFVVPTRLLADSMTHFHTTTDEITFSPCPTHLEIANVGDASVETKSNLMVTKVKLHQSEFNSYHTDKTNHLTFCLRELRAIAGFCDFVGAALRTVFEEAGSPIIFLVRSDRYTADFVLSTVNMGAGADVHPSGSVSNSASEHQTMTSQEVGSGTVRNGNSQMGDAISAHFPESNRPTPARYGHQSGDQELPYSCTESLHQSQHRNSQPSESCSSIHGTNCKTANNIDNSSPLQPEFFERDNTPDNGDIVATPLSMKGQEQTKAESPYVGSFGTVSCQSQGVMASIGGMSIDASSSEAYNGGMHMHTASQRRARKKFAEDDATALSGSEHLSHASGAPTSLVTAIATTVRNSDGETEEEDEEFVPATPPQRKRFKSLYRTTDDTPMATHLDDGDSMEQVSVDY